MFEGAMAHRGGVNEEKTNGQVGAVKKTQVGRLTFRVLQPNHCLDKKLEPAEAAGDIRKDGKFELK